MEMMSLLKMNSLATCYELVTNFPVISTSWRCRQLVSSKSITCYKLVANKLTISRESYGETGSVEFGSNQAREWHQLDHEQIVC